MSVKSRLQQRKTWFTLSQAAQRLSEEFNEDISIEDVVELAMEGDLDVWIESHTFQRAMRISSTTYDNDLFTLVPPGIYRVGIRDPLLTRYLRHKLGPDGLGGKGPRLPLWSISKFDEGIETGLLAPLQQPGKLIFDPMPFPPLEGLKIRREELEAFIVEASNQNSEPASEKDELKAIEVLGLLAEALSQQHPGPYATAGRPNKSGIVSTMLGVVEGYERPAGSNADPVNLYGFRKSTLDKVLKAAIKAWEARKNS